MVARAEAEVAFEAGEYARAAALWGGMRGAEPSFEEVALRFVGARATDALQAFLQARLAVLGPDDKAQARALSPLPALTYWPATFDISCLVQKSCMQGQSRRGCERL